jgi:NADPH-dependent glutamate synthase beta subunit-like oxidoreductase
MTAIDFLHEANCGDKKISGKVVVVGGGNVAIDAARVAKRSGASEVTMLSLETEDIMPASLEERMEAREDGVIINPGWGPKEIKNSYPTRGTINSKLKIQN